MKIKLEFSGGMELLFNKQKEIDMECNCVTMYDLLIHIRDNMLQERPELFMAEDTIRPGVLVLINDTDWEILDENDYKLQENDIITFISTLHGG